MPFHGGLISYRLYGDLHSRFPPVTFFHGTPTDSLQAGELHVPAKKMSLKIIAIDRPGLGFTTHDPKRVILDFHKYLVAILQYLRIKSFYMISISGGTPYLLSSLKYFGPREVLGVAIVADVPPWYMAKPHLDAISRAKLLVVNRLPDAVQTTALAGLHQVLAKTVGTSAAQAFLPKAVSMLGNDLLDLPPTANPVGALLDTQLMQMEWGFSPTEVRYKGIKMWYSEKDTIIALAAGKALSNKLRKPILKIVKAPGHEQMMVDHGEAVLKDLAGWRRC